MIADDKTRDEVLSALDALSTAYARRDAEALGRLFAADALMYGTGADEKRIGRAEVLAQAQRDWAQTDAVSLGWRWTSVSAAGPVAWLSADAAFQLTAGGQHMEIPARVTAVLERGDAGWRFVNAHFSVPAASEGDSIAS